MMIKRTGLCDIIQEQTEEVQSIVVRNVLFNDALSTFYLRLYGLLFPISSKGSFICIIPQTGQHISRLSYTSCGALA